MFSIQIFTCQDLRQGKILLTESSGNESRHAATDADNDDVDDDDYEDFWADDYDDYEEFDDNPIIKARINFEKYGRKTGAALSEDGKKVVDGLPKNIYCDLVQTLNKKCIQTSLLGEHKYMNMISYNIYVLLFRNVEV